MGTNISSLRMKLDSDNKLTEKKDIKFSFRKISADELKENRVSSYSYIVL